MLFIKKVPEGRNEGIKNTLKKLGVHHLTDLKRGEIKLYNIGSRRIKKIEAALTENGYSITTDKKEILSEKIKLLIEKMLQETHMPVINISAYIAKELDHNYTYLSNLFSELNGITIEHYIIRCRILKAKKLIRETGSMIGVIARALHYKSITHFSAQFKKITGLTPTEYKNSMAQKGCINANR